MPGASYLRIGSDQARSFPLSNSDSGGRILKHQLLSIAALPLCAISTKALPSNAVLNGRRDVNGSKDSKGGSGSRQHFARQKLPQTRV